MNKFIDGMKLCDELENAIANFDVEAASKLAMRLRPIAVELDAASNEPPMFTFHADFLIRAINDCRLETARRAVEIIQIMLAEELAEIGSA